MKRLLLLATCLLCLPFLGGCVCPYCAYPTFAYTPSIKLETNSGDVHAFRVDLTRFTADLGVFDDGPWHERLLEIPLTNPDEVPSQLKPSLTYGFAVNAVALSYLTYTEHAVALRVYRPGYELVQIRSWQQANRISWTRVPDLEGQEKVLDTLFPPCLLVAGSESTAHCAALLFGASEYERLAALAQSDHQRVHLSAKATRLRDRAKD
jgi:hypothetical protein